MSITEAITDLDRLIDIGRGRVPANLMTEARAVRDRVVARRSVDPNTTVVALLGATGSGKSSLFNAIVGSKVAQVNAIRPTTRVAQSVSGGEHPELLDHLEVSSRSIAPSMPDDLVLIDLPDIDSTEYSHREIAAQFAKSVDLLIWVLDPQKYADAIVHEDYLSQMSEHSDVTLVVLNHIDTVDGEERARVMADVQRLIAADGVNASVVATSAKTGEGVAELRRTVEKMVSKTNAAQKRLTADIRSITSQIAQHVGPDAPGVSKKATSDISTAILHAAGAKVAAKAAGKSYAHRGGQKVGPPVFRTITKLKGDPLAALHLDGSSDVPGVTSVRAGSAGVERVSQVVRTASDEATEGMSPSARRDVAERAEGAVPSALDRADQDLARTDVIGRNPTWWSVWNVLQWLSFLAAVAGLLWLGGLWVADYMQFTVTAPSYRGFPIPTMLVIGGIILVLLLTILGRIFLSQGRKRAERRTMKKLAAVMSQGATSRITSLIDGEVSINNEIGALSSRMAKLR